MRPLVVDLQFFDAESSHERGIPAPSFGFGYLGRNFYSAEKYAEARREQEEATDEKAEDASSEASTVPVHSNQIHVFEAAALAGGRDVKDEIRVLRSGLATFATS